MRHTFLWGVLPYVAFVLLAAGTVWRYRYDKFGWTTRSSQIHESRLLNVASPAFHYGILFVLVGHLMGLFVPESTTRNDKLMYAVLLAAIGMGMWAKLANSSVSSGYDYRESIAPWARSLFTLRPDVDAMTGVPLTFQLHAVIGMTLIALVPFTRLIHMFSAPVQYLFRPYVVYRSQEAGEPGRRKERRGWEKVDS
ncbi:respiratory nitrate reductase subunit gamma [Streptomyces spectabilis]|uniref:respiratory nitrate reductase subunit gamma n=1 Tax=Streptomyces spectabilis TaxID=68270 RepID=UPI0033F652E4